jgi:1-acyl-sn-glycerol-3-phosphate acyltransferase
MKNISKIHSLWIILKSIGATIWLSLLCIYLCYRKKSIPEIDRALRAWAKGLLSIIKLSYKIYNPEQVNLAPHRAYILMSNHASLYDIPLIFMALPGNIRMVAKKELFNVPIWGHAMKACKFISIDRKNSAQAIEDLKIAKKQMEEENVILWIAPEGTRSLDGKLNPFKAGGFLLALQTNAIIIPIGIRGAGKILPPKTLNFCLDAKVEVHVGKPIDTSEYSVKTRRELIKKVRESILSLANIEE